MFFLSRDLLPKIISVRLDLPIYNLCIPISIATTHATCAFSFSTRGIPPQAEKRSNKLKVGSNKCLTTKRLLGQSILATGLIPYGSATQKKKWGLGWKIKDKDLD